MDSNTNAEEKMDDCGFWQSPSRRGCGGGHHHHHYNDQSAMYNQLLRELSLFVTGKEESCDSSLPLKKKTKVEVSADAERLLRDAVAAFSDARPPTNFVVYDDLSEEEEQEENDGEPRGGAAASPQQQQQQQRHTRSRIVDGGALDGPPIFDGSVANATPQTGGAGTILHLACALDEPLCLAFGLAMGADARACHTAFRRLMIHEAACNGSIQCLTLLLELGRHYGKSTLQDNDADAKLPPRLSRHSTRSTFELPFLPRRLDRSEVMAPLHMYAALQSGAPPQPLQSERLSRQEQQQQPSRQSSGSFLGKKKKHAGTQTSSPSSAAARDANGADFLTLLQRFRLFARQVKKGELTELDAARKVLQLATLSESSKSSLARSCAFDLPQPNAPELALRSRGRSPNSGNANSNNSSTSDGHGNTPLHWAAFKNETECVSLLLKYGANPNARAHPSGWTPLHDAAYSDSMEAVELLIDAGAMVDARANSGATPLCFAAQEDSAKSAALLLEKGADLSARCAGGVRDEHQQGNNNNNAPVNPPSSSSRFSGYTPLHYCAHYNAKDAARVLLRHYTAQVAMEIPDLNDRLAIHVAVARGSSAVLRELLHAGARVVTRSSEQQEEQEENGVSTATMDAATSTAGLSSPTSVVAAAAAAAEPTTPRRVVVGNNNQGGANGQGNVVVVSTPVSSPVLRSMIPSQPVTSSKPWNCLTQQSIDECRRLICEAEMHWSPNRHALFTPADRRAVTTLLLTGKRLEQSHGMFLDLWPQVLSFCGRGWFDPVDPSQAPAVLLPNGGASNRAAAATAESPLMSALYYNTTTPAGSNGAAAGEENYDDSLSLPHL